MKKTYEDGLRECLKILEDIYGSKWSNRRLKIKTEIMKKLFNISKGGSE